MKSKTPFSAFSLIAIMLVGLIVISCAPAKVSTAKTDEDLSYRGERWNATDSRVASAELINDLLSRDLLSDFRASKNRKPVMMLTLDNLTGEPIDLPLFIRELKKQLELPEEVVLLKVHDDRYRVIPGSYDKGLSEADFLISGKISYKMQTVRESEVKAYNAELELINLKENKPVWRGIKEVRKLTPPLIIP